MEPMVMIAFNSSQAAWKVPGAEPMGIGQGALSILPITMLFSLTHCKYSSSCSISPLVLRGNLRPRDSYLQYYQLFSIELREYREISFASLCNLQSNHGRAHSLNCTYTHLSFSLLHIALFSIFFPYQNAANGSGGG